MDVDNRLLGDDSGQTKPANIFQGIFHGKKVKDFTATANEINQELDLMGIRKFVGKGWNYEATK